jgi:imidazolonepropionase-like amidohydrolase
MRLRSVFSFSLFWALLLCGVCRAADLALVGAKIYPSPTEPPIENGSIVVRDGRIFAVGSSASIKIPREAKVINCKGLVVTAGFWNSHVHILTPGLLHAEKLPPEQIDSQLREMLTGRGFTTVFDIASVLENTNLIRGRIKTGEVKGPRILTVGEPFWVKTPIYVKAFLTANEISIPEGESATQARKRVHQQIIAGADAYQDLCKFGRAGRYCDHALRLGSGDRGGISSGPQTCLCSCIQ